MLQLDRDDKISLGTFLAFQLQKHVSVGDTKAEELAGLISLSSSLEVTFLGKWQDSRVVFWKT